MPHLEYSCSVWNHHTKDKTSKIEPVQRRAARYVTNCFERTDSVTSMLLDLKWETLESRRKICQFTLLFKIVNDLIDVPADPYLKPSNARTRALHSRKFCQPHTRTNIFKFSFFPHSIPSWNSLLASAADAPSRVSFKRELSKLSF